MSESNVWKALKRNWPDGGYIRRMEPGLIGEGFPDCHAVINKRDLFIELKFLAKDFKHKKLPIRDSQVVWFLDYPGEYSYFLFKVGDFFYLFSGQQADELRHKIRFERFVEMSIIKSKKIKNLINHLTISING